MDKATIASMSQAEWESLDLWKWLIAHYKPYTGAIAQAMKRRFGSYEPNEVENLIYVHVFPALVSIHRSHLNATGEARNQVLFRTILITATKRIPWLIGKNFPLYEVKAIDHLAHCAQHTEPEKGANQYSSDGSVPEWVALDTIMYAAASSDGDSSTVTDDQEMELNDEDTRISTYIERLRTTMPQRWYQVLRMGACDRMEPREIAEKLGVSQDHIYTIRSRTKRLLSDILHRNKLTPAFR